MSNVAVTAGRLRRSAQRNGFALVAVGLGVDVVVETISVDTLRPIPLYLAVGAAMTVPIAFLRRFPLAACAIIYLALIVPVMDGGAGDPMYIMFALVAAAYGVGAHADRGHALAGLALIVATMVATVPLDPTNPGYGDAAFLSVVLGTPWGLGRALRRRHGENVELADRADLLEREREHLAQIAVAQERARIARELHDVVAHSVSVIAVQTSAVRRRIALDRPDDATTLLTVEATARQALAEMRRLLDVLRTDPDSPALSPQPGLVDLEALADQVRAAGLAVELRIEGARAALPAGVDLTCYRIVQEALTNTRKHAGPARAVVVLRYGHDQVSVHICDDGSARPAATPGGHGLVGMRERVALYGGKIEVGPRPGGGFAVHATLPVDRP